MSQAKRKVDFVLVCLIFFKCTGKINQQGSLTIYRACQSRTNGRPALNFKEVWARPVVFSYIGEISAISCPFLELSAGRKVRAPQDKVLGNAQSR
ncbi:MAG: hypothetical protein DRH15_08535 [Deltaproteobacteria bacterium]|nr:MAG: hypothetical protein DRH15_08535 [Deltaproteobacteria bacterium]